MTTDELPEQEILADLKALVFGVLVDRTPWAAGAVLGALTQCFKGRTATGRAWDGLDRRVADILSEEVVWHDQNRRTPQQVVLSVEAVVRAELRQEVGGRALYNLFGGRWPSEKAAEVAAKLGMSANEAEKWLFRSPYLEALIQAVYDAVMPPFLDRTVLSFFIASPNEHGFYGFEPGAEPEGIRFVTKSLKKERAEIDGGIALSFERARLDNACDHAFRLYNVSCVATESDGRAVGYIEGYVVQQIGKGRSNAAFFDACDSVNQALANMGDALIKQTGQVHRVLDTGPLLYLIHWEIPADLRGRGLGHRLLTGYLEHLKRSFRGMSTITLEFAPHQFPDPFDMQGPEPVCEAYARAVAKIMTHWQHIGPHRVLGERGRSIPFQIRSNPSHGQQLLTLAKHTMT